MLVKQLLTNGGDYEKSLRQRRWAAIALLSVGLVGIACYFLLVPDSGLPDFVQGFYLGAASGISFGGLGLLVRTQYLIAHPQAQRKARIKETDERQMHIARTAAQFAGVLTFFASAAAMFVVLPLSMAAFKVLMAVMILYASSFYLSNLWLSQKL